MKSMFLSLFLSHLLWNMNNLRKGTHLFHLFLLAWVVMWSITRVTTPYWGKGQGPRDQVSFSLNLPQRVKGLRRAYQILEVSIWLHRWCWEQQFGFCSHGTENWGLLGRVEIHLTKQSKMSLPIGWPAWEGIQTMNDRKGRWQLTKKWQARMARKGHRVDWGERSHRIQTRQRWIHYWHKP